MHRQASVKRVVNRQIRTTSRQLGDQVLRKKILLTVVATFIFMLVLIPFFTFSSIAASFAAQIVDTPDKITKAQVAIVFSEYLPDSEWGSAIEQASKLISTGKVRQLLIIGNTAKAAQITGLTPGQLDTKISQEDLFKDCYKLRFEHDITDAVVLAPMYMMHRLLYTCSAAGIQLQGQTIDDQSGVDNLGKRIDEMWQAPGTFWRVNFIR
jgi:vancomycin permeability regulator SanA